jgi:RNA polymerase sigma-70 factor (ECF subfamily)
MPDESHLITALRQKDSTAFAALFETYSDKIFRLAVGLLGDEDEAEGIVQESFLRLFEKLEQFEGRAKLGTWLYRVAYNASVDRLRQRRPHYSLIEEPDEQVDSPLMPILLTDWSQAPDLLFASTEAGAELEQAIAELPERLRGTFILREIEGLSTAETAEVLGINEGTVKVQLHRARLLLRERLSGYFSERMLAAKG